ncbi:MAG: J domain-containing protein [Thermodesulfovibrionales bacterium]
MNHSVRPDLLHLAKLINKFRLSDDPNVIYDMAIDNYDALLELIENQKSVVKLALMAEIPVSKVRTSAEAIIDSLLFNKNNDPCLSLGLRGNEDKSTITKRWRQLITIFHPDRYPGSKVYEEKAKRINEAYEEIRRSGSIKKERFNTESGYTRISKPQKAFVTRSKKIKISRRNTYLRGYFKYLPLFIIASMFLVSLIFIFLLIKKF